MVEDEVLSDFESFSYVLPETFYGIKKAFSVVMQWRDKVGTYAHFFRKMYGKISKNFDFFLRKKFFLAPDNFLSPTFGMVVPSNESYKRYLGIFEIEIFALFGDIEVEKISIFRKKKSIF